MDTAFPYIHCLYWLILLVLWGTKIHSTNINHRTDTNDHYSHQIVDLQAVRLWEETAALYELNEIHRDTRTFFYEVKIVLALFVYSCMNLFFLWMRSCPMYNMNVFKSWNYEMDKKNTAVQRLILWYYVFTDIILWLVTLILIIHAPNSPNWLWDSLHVFITCNGWFTAVSSCSDLL